MRPEPQQVAERLRGLDVTPSETEVERLWRGARARRRRPAGRAALVAAVLLVVVGLGLYAWGSGPASALRLADGHLASEVRGRAASARIVRFDDGSVIALDEGTELEVLASLPRAIRFDLRRGRARYDVVPGGGRAWTIRCGGALVSVLGTAFTLTREEDALRVEVERGRVSVRAEGEDEQVLGAADVLVVEHAFEDRRAHDEAEVRATTRVPPTSVAATPSISTTPAPPTELVPAPAIATPRTQSTSPTSTSTSPTSPSPSTPAPSDAWRELARARDWNEAYDALGAGGPRAAAEHAEVADLLLLSDVCRSSRHYDDAAWILERIVSEHADDAAAPLAAYTLGALEMDRLHRPDRAVRAFDRALALGLPSGMVADAERRRAAAAEAAGE